MLGRDVEAEFLGRIIEISTERNVGDGRPYCESCVDVVLKYAANNLWKD